MCGCECVCESVLLFYHAKIWLPNNLTSAKLPVDELDVCSFVLTMN